MIATHNVGRYVENKADVEALEIPRTVRQYLTRFVDDEDTSDDNMDDEDIEGDDTYDDDTDDDDTDDEE